MTKKTKSIIFLFSIAILSQIIWIIEYNPYFTNDFNWTSFSSAAFFIAPFLFFLWLILSKIYNFNIKSFILILISYIFVFIFTVILIESMHSSGLVAIFYSKIFPFPNNGIITIFFTSIIWLLFNIIVLKNIGVKIEEIQSYIFLYFSIFSIIIFLFIYSLIINIIDANNIIKGFHGFNNFDTILWFKSGIVIPIFIIYEGIIIMKFKNLTTAST